MLFTSTLAAAATSALLLASSAYAAPLEERADANTPFALSIDGTGWDVGYLETLRLSYANSSAFIGEIKYEEYSEPLIVNGAGVNGAGDGISFESIHSSPTGFQLMYVVPHQTKPVGFSVPHGGPPTGVRTSGFSFGPKGNLLNNKLNLFWACQNAEEAALNTYQVWWFGAGKPNGVSCKKINIRQSDPLARF